MKTSELYMSLFERGDLCIWCNMRYEIAEEISRQKTIDRTTFIVTKTKSRILRLQYVANY